MALEVYWLELAESKLEDIYSYYSVKASEKVAKKTNQRNCRINNWD